MKNDKSNCKRTLFALHMVGGACVFACWQSAGEQYISRSRLVLRVGKAGVSAPAAQ